MGAKFSVLPQRNETDAQMSEKGTLAVYSERLVTIGCQLVVRRRAERRRAERRRAERRRAERRRARFCTRWNS